MRTRSLLPLVLPLALAAYGCNETSPTTAPEPGNAAPIMPDDDAPATASGDAPATASGDDEIFDDEPITDDERDVDDAG